MRTPPSPLLPLLRSRIQGDLLAATYLNPEQEFTISEVADRIGASMKTVQKEVTRLVAAGLLEDRRAGTARMVRSVRNSVLTQPLTDLLAVTYGPLPVLTRCFSALTGIKQAFIHGAWAARYDGEPGPLPDDVDVVVIGTVRQAALTRQANEATAILRRRVVAHRVSATAWENQLDLFVVGVRTQNLLELPLTRRSSGAARAPLHLTDQAATTAQTA